MKPRTSSHQIRLVFLCLCLCIGRMSGLIAQTPAKPPSSPPPATTGSSESPVSAKKSESDSHPEGPLPDKGEPEPDMVYLKDHEGKLVPVVKGLEFESYLRFLEQTRKSKNGGEQEWSIGRLSLVGESKSEFAEFTAEIEIEIYEKSRTVIVPLRMNEATIRDEEHTGSGQCGLLKQDSDQGQLWWFRGAGSYRLTLKLLMPIRTKDQPSRRLLLTLPPTTVSDLRLLDPAARVRPLSDEGAARIKVSSENGASIIELFGLGTRLDFTWQPIPGGASLNPTFHSRTAMNVMIDGKSVLIEANQRIEPLQGEFSELTVKLPAGMELIKLEGTGYREHRLESQDQTRIRILLEKGESHGASPVDLKWLLQGKISDETPEIRLGGFEVDHGRIQSGVAVVRVGGPYRVQRLEAQYQNVIRESLGGLERMTSPPMPGLGDPSNIVGVYRILDQPFQLTLALKKIDAYVSAEQPLFVTHFSGNSAELEATFVVQVARGTVDHFPIDWPEWRKSGWQIDKCTAHRISERGDLKDEVQYETTLDSSGNDGIDVQTSEPVSGHIQIRLNAKRELDSARRSTSEIRGENIRFPGLSHSAPENAVLIATLADNLDLDSKPAGGTTIRPLDPPQINSELMDRNADRRRMAYLLNNYQSGLNVQTTIKPSSLAVESLTTLNTSDPEVNIEQLLSYSVSYQRFSQLLIWVPNIWLDRCEFRLSTGEELNPIITPSTDPGYQQVRLPLGKSIGGNFQLQIRAHQPLNPSKDNLEFQISLARPAEERLTRTRLQTHPFGGIEFRIQDEDWVQDSTAGNPFTWISPNVSSEIRVRLAKQPETEDSAFVVEKAWLRTIVNGIGEEFHKSLLLVRGADQNIRLRLPDNSKLESIRIRDVEVKPEYITDNPGVFQVGLPQSGESGSDGPVLLECNFVRLRQKTANLLHPLEASTIELPGNTSWRDVVWELILPTDEHLLNAPAEFNPDYSWKRRGTFYSRVNDSQAKDLANWMGVEADRFRTPIGSDWNSYSLSRFGKPPTLRCFTIRRHLIIAIGTGCALAVSFVLLNFPLMRHVLVFWSLGTLLSIAGIWYSEPVILFLQPAIVGFLLGLISSIVQLWWKADRKFQSVVKVWSGKTSSNPSPHEPARSSVSAQAQPETSLRSGSPVGQSGFSV